MRRSALVLVAGLLGTTALCGDSWQSYRSPDGFYSVDFPAKPQTHQKKQDVHGYKVPMDIAICSNANGAFGVIRMNIGAVIPDVKGKEEQFLSLGFDGFTQGKGYRMLSKESFRMNGHPGIHAVMHKNGVEEQTYVIGKDGQVVFIVVAGKPGTTVNPASNKFIASFRLR